MKLRTSNLYLAFIALCGCLMLVSCHDIGLTDESENPGNQLPPNDSPVVMFHISAINTGSQSAATDVQEKIKSLRIIMIHEGPDGVKRLEANRLIAAHDQPSNNFVYIFQKRTAVGKKKFYLIANEESIKSVKTSGASDSTQEPDDAGGSDVDDPTVGADDANGNGLPATPSEPVSLTQFLNRFEPDMVMDDFGGGFTAPDEDKTGIYAKNFEADLNSLHFEPIDSYDVVGNTVFLPYSAYYDFEIKESNGYEVDFTGEPMYLVPVATKFTFKFINYREKETCIDYLVLEKFNKTNYLMANLNDAELNKSYGGKPYYWIDWLKMVSDATQTPGDWWNSDENSSINSQYGWISGYHTPKEDYESADNEEKYDAKPYDFVNEKVAELELKDENWVPKETADEPWTIPGYIDEDTPCEDQFYGPFYLPEGHNLVTEVITEEEGDDGSVTEIRTTKTSEKYILRLKMRDYDADVNSTIISQVKTASTEISNLKALFRNTSVLITITMREGGVKIYAQQEPWVKKVFNGYVQDEDEIK